MADTQSLPDRRVVQCNYAEATKIAAKGARAYVCRTNAGWDNERIVILVRPRGGGRWIEKWESTARLRDFRVTTLPPEHPRYGDQRLLAAEHAEDLLKRSDTSGDVTSDESATSTHVVPNTRQ